jgi:alcohol dehydrogenase class IV
MAIVEWTRGPLVVSGPGALARLGGETAHAVGGGGPVMLVADPNLPALADRAAEVLAAAGCPVARFAALGSDPTAGQVDEAIRATREAGARAVVGLGGGSALDVAKLAAALAPDAAGADAVALGVRAFGERALPLIAVPTTAGTGSEATRVAIFTRADGTKVWAWSDFLLPAVAILDPETTVGLPPTLTAATGIDALVHAIEAATNRNASSFSRAPALEAIRLVSGNLRRAAAAGHDLEARGAVQRAAFLAGQAIDTAGTGVAHALGHALGSLGRVHHGRAVGLSLGVALAGNAEAAPAPHAAVARAMGAEGADSAALAGLADAYTRLTADVGLDSDLSGLGLDPTALAAETHRPENRPMLDSNCRTYDDADILDLCRRLLAPA